jgi:hypothetical protein
MHKTGDKETLYSGEKVGTNKIGADKIPGEQSRCMAKTTFGLRARYALMRLFDKIVFAQ